MLGDASGKGKCALGCHIDMAEQRKIVDAGAEIHLLNRVPCGALKEVCPNVGDSLSELLILQLVDNGKQLAHFGAVKRVLLQNDCLLFRVNGRESGNSLPFSALLRMNQSSGTAQQR